MFEKRELKRKLGNTNFELLKKYNFIIAGGAIASIFTRIKINDFDVYARNENDILEFLREVWGSNCRLIYHTKKATLLRLNGVLIQLIHFRYYENAYEAFETFDFTACMGAFDFKDMKFHFHKKFMRHNAQRKLVFNHQTTYPLISAIRVNKYKQKGYSISNSEYACILLSCTSLKIDTWEDLKDQLGGMYGENNDANLKKLKNKKFNLQLAIEHLSNGGSLTDKGQLKKIKKLDELLRSISSIHPKYVDFQGRTHEIHADGKFVLLRGEKKVNHVMLDIRDLLRENKLYKFVKKNEDGTYNSYFCNDFKYVIGQMVEPFSTQDLNGRIYCNQKEHIKLSNFWYNSDKTLLEIAFTMGDLLGIEGGTFTITKGFVVREVATDEWKQWE